MDYQELKPRKDETGILYREGIYFHSPSDFARKNLYYITGNTIIHFFWYGSLTGNSASASEMIPYAPEQGASSSWTVNKNTATGSRKPPLFNGFILTDAQPRPTLII